MLPLEVENWIVSTPCELNSQFRDYISWPWDDNGEYTTRAGYNWLIEDRWRKPRQRVSKEALMQIGSGFGTSVLLSRWFFQFGLLGMILCQRKALVVVWVIWKARNKDEFRSASDARRHVGY